MIRKSIIPAVAVGIAVLSMANVAQAFNMGNMMNPSRWFNDNDRYRDRYYDRGRYYDGYYGGGPYGRYGPYGGGYGPYGQGWGGPYGGQPSTIVVNPSNTGSKPPVPRLPQ